MQTLKIPWGATRPTLPFRWPGNFQSQTKLSNNNEWPDPAGVASDTGELVRTYSLITSEANPLLAAIHTDKKRMPVVLTPDAEHAWLHENLTEQPVPDLTAIPYPAGRMHSHAVSKLITSRTAPSDVPEVMAPASYPELADKPELFA